MIRIINLLVSSVMLVSFICVDNKNPYCYLKKNYFISTVNKMTKVIPDSSSLYLIH